MRACEDSTFKNLLIAHAGDAMLTALAFLYLRWVMALESGLLRLGPCTCHRLQEIVLFPGVQVQAFVLEELHFAFDTPS